MQNLKKYINDAKNTLTIKFPKKTYKIALKLDFQTKKKNFTNKKKKKLTRRPKTEKFP